MAWDDLSDEEKEAWRRYVETGTHAYLFIREVPPGTTTAAVVRSLRALVPGEEVADASQERRSAWEAGGRAVLSASAYVGPYPAFAHLWVDGDLAALQDLLDALEEELGVRGVTALAGDSYRDRDGATLMAKLKRSAVVGLVRVWVEAGRSREVLDALGRELGDAFKGGTIVFGDFDLLVEVGGERPADVTEAVLAGIQRVPGVVRTETSFADHRRPV